LESLPPGVHCFLVCLTLWSICGTRTAWTTMMRTAMLFLILFILCSSQYLLQLLVVFLTLLHLCLEVLLHLLLLGISQLGALRTLLLLGSTRLSVRTWTAMMSGTHAATHTRTTQHIFIFCVQGQYLGFLIGCQLEILGHAVSHFLRIHFLGSLALLVVVLCHHSCH